MTGESNEHGFTSYFLASIVAAHPFVRCRGIGVSALVVLFFCSDTSSLRYAVTSLSRAVRFSTSENDGTCATDRRPTTNDDRLTCRNDATKSERVRKLESERVKDAHQCAVIALVDLLTFLHSHLLTVRLRVRQPSSVYRLPSYVSRLTSYVLLLTPDT
jgi:hypothetical protein